jgi:hypothetical protein
VIYALETFKHLLIDCLVKKCFCFTEVTLCRRPELKIYIFIYIPCSFHFITTFNFPLDFISVDKVAIFI